jgi:hypothetical protein
MAEGVPAAHREGGEVVVMGRSRWDGKPAKLGKSATTRRSEDAEKRAALL